MNDAMCIAILIFVVAVVPVLLAIVYFEYRTGDMCNIVKHINDNGGFETNKKEVKRCYSCKGNIVGPYHVCYVSVPGPDEGCIEYAPHEEVLVSVCDNCYEMD